MGNLLLGTFFKDCDLLTPHTFLKDIRVSEVFESDGSNYLENQVVANVGGHTILATWHFDEGWVIFFEFEDGSSLYNLDLNSGYNRDRWVFENAPICVGDEVN